MNNRLVITILTVVSALFLYGCQNDHNTQESVAAPGETLTLRDIQPTMVQEEPEKMIIRAIIYEMPASNIKYLTEVYEAISKQQLRFSDLDVFEENGFVAGLAPEPVWPVISNALHRASAQNILTNNLLFLESSSNDVYAMSTYNRQSFYLHKKNSEPELIKLPAGQLVWTVNARALPQRPGIGLVQIEANHKENVLPTLRSVPGYENTGLTAFNQASIKLNMTIGEFVVIGPKVDESDRVTLADLFFKRTGDIILPITDENVNLNGAGPSYRIEKDVPLVRLYIFACIGITN